MLGVVQLDSLVPVLAARWRRYNRILYSPLTVSEMRSRLFDKPGRRRRKNGRPQNANFGDDNRIQLGRPVGTVFRRRVSVS